MKILILLSLVFLIGCSSTKPVTNEQPLGYSFMPKPFNPDSILPNLPTTPDTLVNKDALSFSPKFFLGGRIGKDSLPPGILISEKSSVRYIFYEAAFKRMKIEYDLMLSLNTIYYKQSLVAEKAYQDEIIKLKKEAERSWLEQNLGYIGFGAGIITTVATGWALVHISK